MVIQPMTVGAIYLYHQYAVRQRRQVSQPQRCAGFVSKVRRECVQCVGHALSQHKQGQYSTVFLYPKLRSWETATAAACIRLILTSALFSPRKLCSSLSLDCCFASIWACVPAEFTLQVRELEARRFISHACTHMQYHVPRECGACASFSRTQSDVLYDVWHQLPRAHAQRYWSSPAQLPNGPDLLLLSSELYLRAK